MWFVGVRGGDVESEIWIGMVYTRFIIAMMEVWRSGTSMVMSASAFAIT